ncbi:MAG: hypothetical protein JRC86_06840 [Deltaproteobacteria bacterium]|nr:hypothetical protein [Deltaproteobacteria bacterium]
MKALKPNEFKSSGRMILLYSATGVGKTCSILRSAPQPIAYIQTEPRSIQPSIDAVLEAAEEAEKPIKLRIGKELDVFQYEGIEDLIETLAKNEPFKRYVSIAVDGLSHLMNVVLAQEITTEAFDARPEADKKTKRLAGLTKMTVEGQGVRNQLMFRLSNLLMQHSQDGKIVICTALEASAPKWDRALSAAPALSAKEFPVNMPGFFDLIGILESRYDEEGKKIYPPRVRFEPDADDDGYFICKYTGIGKRRAGVLDIGMILKFNGWKL